MKKIIWAILVISLLCIGKAEATCLSAAAATLAAGSWVEVSSCMTGLTSTNFDSTSNGMFAFTDSMTWDPTSRGVYFAGRGHGDPVQFLHYDDDTDTWTRSAAGSGCGALGHAYDHNAIDTIHQVLYHRCNDSTTVLKYDIVAQSWSTIAAINAGGNSLICCGGLAFHEQRDELFFTWATGYTVWRWNRVSNTWSEAGSGGYTQGEPESFAQYNPVTGVLLFGSGVSDTHIWRYNADGTITARAAAPASVNSNEGYVSLDPVSGKFLFLYRTSGSTVTNFYSYDDNTQTYTALTLPPFANSIEGDVGIGQTPISSYGVSLWCTHSQGSTPHCYLYKLTAVNPWASMPTIAQETAAYNLWGWEITASTRSSATVTDPCGTGCNNVSDIGVHGDSEGDDLWSYLMMARRGGAAMYALRAAGWLTYFKNDYVQCVGESDTFCYDRDSFLLDHVYGQGLVEKYYENGDSVAYQRAIDIATEIETFYSGKTCGSYEPTYYSFRAPGRQLEVATLVAQMTGFLSRWVTLRDKVLACLENDPGWDATRGMYFVGDYITDDALGAGSYDAGWRGAGTFQASMIPEAMYLAWKQTGADWLRERIVSQARFIQANALNASEIPGLSFFYNINTQQKQWPGGSEYGYATSLTNALVLGYKLSGDASLMAYAKRVFARGTKFDLDGTRFCTFQGTDCQSDWEDDPVHHYMDTYWGSATGYFWQYFNKGELQYAYHLFENGGAPTVEYNEAPATVVRILRSQGY